MKYLLLFLIPMALLSCSDNLNQLPSNKLPAEEAIETVSDLQLAVNGVYASMVYLEQETSLSLITFFDSYSGDFGLYADGKGGDVDYKKNGSHFTGVINLQTNKNSDEANGFYYHFYAGIGRVNDILSFLDQITDKEENKAEYDDLIGQLYAIRGLLHFEALRTFCPMPNLVSDQSAAKSGVVIAKEQYPAGTKFSRASMKDSYEFVEGEFENALKIIGKEKSLGELNYWAVKALRARMYLYLGKHSEALADAVDVIKNSPYTLLTRDNWLSSWRIEEADESLFEVRTSDAENAQRNSIGYYCSPDGYAEVAASEDFLAFYNTLDTGDIRKESLKEESDSDGDYGGWYSQKYRGRDGVTSPLYVNNPKVIRLSELYYIAAEAILSGGTATGAQSAADYYNAVRKNRISPYTDAASVTIDDILDERRIELFCENARLFDVVRLKSEFTHPHFSDPIETTDTRLFTEFPQRELDVNGSGF